MKVQCESASFCTDVADYRCTFLWSSGSLDLGSFALSLTESEANAAV